MDTETFDTEISVTYITKGYIELSTYRIHRNMIKKLMGTVGLAMVASLVVIIQIQQAAYAQNSAYDQGYAQGKADKMANQPNNAICNTDNDVQCSLYKVGYNAGYYYTGLLRGNEIQQQDNNNDDNNDN